MAPGYCPDGFELGDVEALAKQYPAAAPRIRDLAPRNR
jgi:hypothetical protein